MNKIIGIIVMQIASCALSVNADIMEEGKTHVIFGLTSQLFTEVNNNNKHISNTTTAESNTTVIGIAATAAICTLGVIALGALSKNKSVAKKMKSCINNITKLFIKAVKISCLVRGYKTLVIDFPRTVIAATSLAFIKWYQERQQTTKTKKNISWTKRAGKKRGKQ